MKVTMTLKVTIKVDNPDGYPKDFKELKSGELRNKRAKRVLVAHARGVKAAQDEIIELIEAQGLWVEKVDG